MSRFLAASILLLAAAPAAFASIHSYDQEYFYIVGDAYIFRGGREGLYASTKEVRKKKEGGSGRWRGDDSCSGRRAGACAIQTTPGHPQAAPVSRCPSMGRGGRGGRPLLGSPRAESEGWGFPLKNTRGPLPPAMQTTLGVGGWVDRLQTPPCHPQVGFQGMPVPVRGRRGRLVWRVLSDPPGLVLLFARRPARALSSLVHSLFSPPTARSSPLSTAHSSRPSKSGAPGARSRPASATASPRSSCPS
jgi:hypothetical protein